MQVSTKQLHPFADWLTAMLEKRGLHQPDGRPLYRYRLSVAEFDALALLLKSRAHSDLTLLAKQRGFYACWFLFAAEWWKRCYAGGAWAWGPILRDAGIRQDVPQATRSEWVNAAVAHWHLQDRIEHGKRYIGQVVSNGGLPLRLLEEAASGVTKLLNMVQHEMTCSRLPMSDAQVMAALTDGARLLPESYRQRHVLELLADVLQTVKRLNAEAGASAGEDPVQRLDSVHPGWIEDFPLQLDPEHARALLGGLVRRAQVSREQRLFQIVRQLRFDSRGQPARLEVVLETAARIQTERLLELLGIGEEEELVLPAAIDLVLTAQGTPLHAGKLIRRDGVFQVQITVTSLPASWFGMDITLELSRFGLPIGEIELPGGDAPEELQPWVFEDSVPVARLLGCGDVRLRDASCLVVVPPGATSFHLIEDPESLGKLQEREVLRTRSGDLTITQKSMLYQIVCGDVSARETGVVVWRGMSVENVHSQPPRVLLGKEEAFEVLPTGERRKLPANELFWQFEKGVHLPFSGPRKSGMGWLLWKRNGQVKSRARAVCLPTQATIRIEPSEGGLTDGSVILHGWPAESIVPVADQARVAVSREGSTWTLHCQKTSSTPPISLQLTVNWAGGVQKLTVPYPAEGAFVYTDTHETVESGRGVSVSDLLNLHIRIQSARAKRWQVQLQLQDSNGEPLANRCFPVSFVGASTVTDLRLFELQEDVRQLLASVNELDAQVRISVRHDGQECRYLTVARYRDKLVREAGHVALAESSALPEEEVLRESRLLALPMLAPESEAVVLDAKYTESACTGRWAFDPDRFKPGVWLIYPEAGSALDCRPIAWYVEDRFAGPARQHHGLRAAMALVQRQDRLEALKDQFEQMANSPDHADWKLVEHYVRKLGHLPLAGLDLWVALARSPRAVIMALLVVDGFAESIAHRLSTELPFEWLLTSPQDWRQAVSARVALCHQDDEREKRLLKREMEASLEWLRRVYPALELSISLALSCGLSRNLPEEVKMLLAEPDVLRKEWLQRLLHSEKSDVQGLMQRISHAGRGPVELKGYATRFANSVEGGRLLHRFRLPQDDWKFSLAVAPLAIAYDIAEGHAPDWLDNRSRLVALRNYRSFDAHWFDEAYKVAMVCALDDGLIEV